MLDRSRGGQPCLAPREYRDISCYSDAVQSAALRCPAPSVRLGALATGIVLAMTARRGRRGPRFGPGRGFGPFFGPPGGFPRGPRARRGDVRQAALLLLS